MDYSNLAQVLPAQARRLGSTVALRYKRHGLYHDLSWQDYYRLAEHLAAALVAHGVQPGDRVGLLAENRYEWLITDLAILMAGAVTVSPHAPLTARQVHYQFDHAEVVWAFVSDAGQAAKLASLRAELPRLQGIVSFDPVADLLSWHGFAERGRQALAQAGPQLQRRRETLGPDDLAAVIYTSGTTGQPKGVMLTHGNLLSNTLAGLQRKPHEAGDLILSWLPYTHIYARTVDHYGALVAGVPLALAVSPETLVENLAETQPTHMACVPRFYEKILAAVAPLPFEESARRLRGIFGPRRKWLSSGGAALPVGVAQAFAQRDVPIYEGYGLTETSPVISFNTPQANRLGSVGQPLPGVEVRIAEDGEILTRGPHVMKGYWKDPEATAAVFRDDWFCTGDLGYLDDEGFLFITGRKKEMMALSNGKKIAPSNLEGLLVQQPFIDQAIVIGEGHNYLSALIVPAWSAVQNHLQLRDEPAALLEHPAVLALIRAECDAALRDFSPMEQIRKFALLPRPFSVETDEMTVSLKLRRPVILQRYAERIERLYRGEEG
ncbi:MAG: AMP-dependent synthetase/ligase [Gemmataceae bacterium]